MLHKPSVLTQVLLTAVVACCGAMPVSARTSGPPPLLPAPDGMPQVTAPIALMLDVNSGRVLFEREAHRRFVPASLTKIMTSYVAFELIAEGKLSLDQKFPMRPETFRQWRRVGSTMFLDNNSQTSVADLLEGIVTISANDACVVLAEGIAGSVDRFTAMMNEQARRLGMKDTHYHTPNGWMDQGQTYVSAADLATLAEALIVRHPNLYRLFYGHESANFNGIEQNNQNPLYGYTPGADGVKTGFTNEAGYGFVGSVERGGRRVIMVVAGYDRPDDRAVQSRKFVEWAFSAWDSRLLFAAGSRLGEAPVQGGTRRHVALVAPRSLSLALPKGAMARGPAYSLSIRYKGPLTAPIAKGDEVASLIVRVPGQPVAHLPLVAGESVGTGSAFDRLRDGFFALANPVRATATP